MTQQARLRFAQAVTLVGGGAASPDDLDMATALAPVVVAADGGANHLRRWGRDAAAVIGDLDSLDDAAFWRDRAQVVSVAEQDSTDLEKCLYSIDAPFLVGVGFTGLRLDHTLAALHAMVRRAPDRMVLLGESDVIFACPTDWRVTLALGARVSFFPLAPVQVVASSGLAWPLNGLALAPLTQIATSNCATDATVTASFSDRGVVAMVDRQWLGAVLASLGLS